MYKIRSFKTFCYINGAYMLFLISLYCTRFLGDWTINFTTNSSGKNKFSSTS